MESKHIQLCYTANEGYHAYPHSAKDIKDLEGLIQSTGIVHIYLQSHDRNKEWIVGDITELEQHIQDELGGLCKHTFRDWEFREASANNCESSITGVTVDLIIESQ